MVIVGVSCSRAGFPERYFSAGIKEILLAGPLPDLSFTIQQAILIRIRHSSTHFTGNYYAYEHKDLRIGITGTYAEREPVCISRLRP
jgi:hypothetical protein